MLQKYVYYSILCVIKEYYDLAGKYGHSALQHTPKIYKVEMSPKTMSTVTGTRRLVICNYCGKEYELSLLKRTHKESQSGLSPLGNACQEARETGIHH